MVKYSRNQAKNTNTNKKIQTLLLKYEYILICVILHYLDS